MVYYYIFPLCLTCMFVYAVILYKLQTVAFAKTAMAHCHFAIQTCISFLVLYLAGGWHVEFLLWAAVIYPSLLQLERGVTDSEDKKQKAVCMERYRRRDDDDYWQSSDVDIEREDECGICMEMNSKIVLPNCYHAMCLKCYREWYFLLLIFLVCVPVCATPDSLIVMTSS